MAETVEDMKKKIEKIEARMQKKLNREKEKERKLDTRRKIVLGAVMFKLMKDNQQIYDFVLQQLNEHVVNERDRALFDLKEKCVNIGVVDG